MHYPTTFAEAPVPLRELDLDDRGREAVETLAEKGFEMFAGLPFAAVPEVGNIAWQAPVREYCPKDVAERFGNEEMARKWHTKGRGPFLLRQTGSHALAAYSWTGPVTCDELPGALVTFATRISEEFGGRGLATPVTIATISGSAALYGAECVGLETWASNTRAVRSYLKAGAVLVNTRDDRRPTLSPDEHEIDSQRRDVRLFMKFPYTFPGQPDNAEISTQLSEATR